MSTAFAHHPRRAARPAGAVRPGRPGHGKLRTGDPRRTRRIGATRGERYLPL